MITQSDVTTPQRTVFSSFIFLLWSVIKGLALVVPNFFFRMLTSISFDNWIRIGGAVGFLLIMRAWHNEITHINVAGPTGVTVGQLLLIYGALVLLTLYTGWNIFFHELAMEEKPKRKATSGVTKRAYTISGYLMLARYGLFTFGLNQDIIWHYAKGVPVDHFWWLPHILMYVSFLLGGIPLYFWARMGFSRRWARQNWPIVLAGFSNAYFVFSGVLDENWHNVLGTVGFDFNGFSPAHFPILITQTVGLCATIAIFVKAYGLTIKTRVLAILLGIIGLNLLMHATSNVGEWFFPKPDEPLDAYYWVRPGWVWGVLNAFVGLGTIMFMIKSTKLPGAATMTVVGTLAIRAFTDLAVRAMDISPESLPLKNAVLPVLLGVAIVADLLYWLNIRHPIALGLAAGTVYWILAGIIYPIVGVGTPVTASDIVIAILITLIFIFLYIKSISAAGDNIAYSYMPI